MELADVSIFSRHELFERLREVRLRGFGGARPYALAEFEIVEGLDADRVTPAQNYVLRDGVRLALELRERLSNWNIDPFSLNGGVTFRLSCDLSARTLIPPIIEESAEDDGRVIWLVSDGMHRIYAARSLSHSISVVLVRGSSFPYYAYPVADGWLGVQEFDQLPDVHQKKDYRLPGNYKALFRDYNGPFPNIQATRASSNPPSLKAGG